MKSKIRAVILLIFILCFFVSGCSSFNKSEESKNKRLNIGVVVGTFDDTWRTTVRNKLYEMAGKNLDIEIWNGDNSQKTENEKIDTLIKNKVNVLVVNPVEASSADSIIEKAKKADIPVVFFNIQPSSDALNKWNKVYYVGAKAEQSGSMQGELLTDYFKEHPARNGIIRYVMLKGPETHQDAIARTKYSIKTMEDSGLKLQKVGEETASWQRDTAQNKMEDIIKTQGDNIDCVIANNDDMALGAIDALKNNGYFQNGKYIPVVGVDSNSSAVNSIKNSILLGSVLNDADAQAKAVFNLAKLLASGKSPDKNNYSNTITDGKYIWIDYKKITKDNINDIK